MSEPLDARHRAALHVLVCARAWAFATSGAQLARAADALRAAVEELEKCAT